MTGRRILGDRHRGQIRRTHSWNPSSARSASSPSASRRGAWATCDGQLLPINQNQALFALLGTTYGGDGITTFALPDLRGRVPVHAGHGAGLSVRTAGQRGGSEKVALTVAEIPIPAEASRAAGEETTDDPATVAAGGAEDGSADASSAPGLPAGPGKPHRNMPPFLVLEFVIALEGIFPARP